MDIDLETGSRLIRAARAMARMDIARFAKALVVGEATVKRVEAGISVRASTLERMIKRLHRVGVVITEPDEVRGVGPGVALFVKRKKTSFDAPFD